MGKVMVNMMNRGHARLAKWGLSHVTFSKTDNVLDVGCGGGMNVSTMTSFCTEGMVTGIDYSEVSVEASKKQNRTALSEGRCRIVSGSVQDLPFPENSFDVVTAFETIYFWPEIEMSFKEVFRVVKPNGIFFICNESDGQSKEDEKWTSIIEGMTTYTEGELRDLLTKAGFADISADWDKEKHWLCLTAVKPVTHGADAL